jgi:lipase chaperone LimK
MKAQGGIMSVPVVSTVGSSTSALPESVNQMQRQVALLRRHLAVEQQGHMNEETKAKRIQALELQILQLQSRVMQKQARVKGQASNVAADGSPPGAT